MNDQIEVRTARPEDLEEVLDILREAAEWLLSRGINQWPRRFQDSFILEPISRGDTRISLVEGQPAGTITLQQQDPIFWPDAPEDGLYIHRVAVRRSHAGLGLFLVSWAEQWALTQNKRYLRLDCWDGNAELRRYYEELGFQHRGHIDVIAESRAYRSALYEKALSESQ